MRYLVLVMVLALAFSLQAGLSMIGGSDGSTLVCSEGSVVVALGGLEKAGPNAHVAYTQEGNWIRAVCTVTNSAPDFKANLCMFRRHHHKKIDVTSTEVVGRWTRPFDGALPVEETAATIITYGKGPNAVRYVYPGASGVKADWSDGTRQHLPLTQIEEGVYRGTLLVAMGDQDDAVALAARAEGRNVAAAIACGRTYRWFEGDEPIVFTARGFNTDVQSRELRLGWRVRDWDNKIVAEGAEKGIVSAGELLMKTVSFNPPERRGIYFVEVRMAGANGETAFARTNLVRLPPFTYVGDPAKSIFGLAAYWPIPDEESVQRLMDRMGVRYVRMGDTRLQHPPRIAFRHTNPRPHHLKGVDREAWIRSELEACVTNRNPCWECGNELNMSTAGIALKGGGIGKALLAEPYAEFVREVRRIMREEGYDQKVKLLSVGVAGFDRAFFERTRALGTWDLLDGFCLHPGRGNFTPDYPFVRPEAAQGGAVKTEDVHDADRLDHSSFWNFLGAVRDCRTMLGDRPLYLTEVYTPTYPNSWWEDGLRDSADNTVLTYALALASGVKVAFYYQLFDSVWFNRLGINPKNREYFFGLVNRDLSFKPAMMGYIAAAEALDGATFVKWLKLPNETSHGILFDTPRGRVACLWDRSEGYQLTERPRDGERYRSSEPYVRHWTKTVSVGLPAKDPVRVTDSLGRTGAVPVRDGQVELRLDGSPQFVSGCRF